MSASLIPEAKGATEEQTSIQKMLIENGRLIEAIAEYQRLGRPNEAMKYQELLHRNLLYLGRLVDPQLAQQIQNIRVLPVVEQPTDDQQPAISTQPQSVPPQQPPLQSQPGFPPTTAANAPYPINGQPGLAPLPQNSIPPQMNSQTPPMMQQPMGIPQQQYPPQ